jgi:hypothetical protein
MVPTNMPAIVMGMGQLSGQLRFYEMSRFHD